jgi:hypothetical protein
MHSRLVQYLGSENSRDGMFDGAPGATLCTFALLIWSMTVMQELRSAVRLFLAIARLPLGDGVLQMSDGGHKLRFTSSSYLQKLGCMALQGVRTYVTVTLGLCASQQTPP